MALSESEHLTETQKRIMGYSALSFVGLAFGVLVGVIVVSVAMLFVGLREPGPSIVLATMAIAVAVWIPILLHCRKKSACPACGAPLLRFLWSAEFDFISGTWRSTIPTRCTRCSSELP
jgi:hypothetical protein